MKYCPYCGKEIKDNFNNCPYCGNNLKEEKKEYKRVIDSNGKSKIAAGLLAIFFGAFGIHNFYLGYKNTALTQLLLTICSFGLLYPATSLWGIIEGIMILTGSIKKDSDGNPLID